MLMECRFILKFIAFNGDMLQSCCICPVGDIKFFRARGLSIVLLGGF